MNLYLVRKQVTDDEWKTSHQRDAYVTAPDFESVVANALNDMNGMRHCQKLEAISEQTPICAQIKESVIDDDGVFVLANHE